MSETVILWVFGTLITCLSAIITGCVVGLWWLNGQISELKVELAGNYHSKEEIEKAIEKAIKPVVEAQLEHKSQLVDINKHLMALSRLPGTRS